MGGQVLGIIQDQVLRGGSLVGVKPASEIERAQFLVRGEGCGLFLGHGYAFTLVGESSTARSRGRVGKERAIEPFPTAMEWSSM